jgi:hypothetical protein
MAGNTLGSIVHPEINNPEVAFQGNFKPVKLPTTGPELSEQARLCVQSFANATGVPADRVASEAILHWWDNHGGFVVQEMQRKAD